MRTHLEYCSPSRMDVNLLEIVQSKFNRLRPGIGRDVLWGKVRQSGIAATYSGD